MKTSANRLLLQGGWRQSLASIPQLALLLILIAYPLLALFIQIVLPHLFDYQTNWHISLGPLAQVFADKDNLAAIFNSILFGAAGAILATVLGALTAFGAARAGKKTAAILNTFIWIVFFTPSYIVAQGWVIFMQDGGLASQLFHLPTGWSSWFFSPFGLVLLMGLRYFPYTHFALQQAVRSIGAEMTEAGRMLGGSRWRLFWSVRLPLLTPALLAGASLAFAEGFGDYGLAAAIAPQMQLPLISYQIELAINQAPVNYSAAAALSLITVLVIAAALWLQFWWLKKKSYVTISSAAKVSTQAASTKGWSRSAALLLAVVAVLIPLGATFCASLWKNPINGIAAGNWGWDNYQQALQVGSDGLSSLLRSGGYALSAAIVTATLGLWLAYQMNFRQSAANRFLSALVMSTIAIPGIVLAAGFVFAWNATWLIPLHLVLFGTPLCLAMAYIAGTLPYSIRLQMGAMSQLSPNLTLAARTLGVSERNIVWRIILPLVRETGISTLLITFTGTMFELPASTLLYPPGSPPFPVTIASKFNAFEWAQGSALAILGMVIVLAVYLLGVWLLQRTLPRGLRGLASDRI